MFPAEKKKPRTPETCSEDSFPKYFGEQRSKSGKD